MEVAFSLGTMIMNNITRGFVCFGLLVTASLPITVHGAETSDDNQPTSSDVERRRTFKLDVLDTLKQEQLRHPLIPALRLAYKTIDQIDRNVKDYTCTLVKRERIQGKLRYHEYMFAKIRHENRNSDKMSAPFSVYLKYMGPRRVKDREVLFMRSQIDSKMIARNGGTGNLKNVTLTLDPRGKLAMRNNHYPITEIGIRNLTQYLIEAGRVALDRDLEHQQCQVKIQNGAKINHRACEMIQVKFPERRENLDFHIARVFLDEQLKLPVRFAYYTWPVEGSDSPRLMEEYTYLDLKVNVGLTDHDFDRDNPEYNFYEPTEANDTSRPSSAEAE